ncbi:MAG TPA: hypothetical protein VKP04_02535, partial [Ktedonobacteraceae bacterium]|nr:hypothetical protein [Ktedonobacteraceae bacterium]
IANLDICTSTMQGLAKVAHFPHSLERMRFEARAHAPTPQNASVQESGGNGRLLRGPAWLTCK